MGYSCYLVTLGQNITGTIFSGATLLIAVSLFVGRKIKIFRIIIKPPIQNNNRNKNLKIPGKQQLTHGMTIVMP